MLALAHPGPRGCRTRANDGSTRVYRGWEDAYPGALVEIREPSLAAPVTAAVVGVVPGAALPALPGGFRDAPEASAGPGGGVPALDSDGRRLGGAPLRETGRDRLLGGRHVNSDADDGGMPAIAGRRRATREMSRMRNVTLRSWKMRALPPQLVLEKSRAVRNTNAFKLNNHTIYMPILNRTFRTFGTILIDPIRPRRFAHRKDASSSMPAGAWTRAIAPATSAASIARCTSRRIVAGPSPAPRATTHSQARDLWA